MKLFWTLLKMTIPNARSMHMKTKLYISQRQPTNSPAPKNPYLKVSITGVTGLRHIKVWTGTPKKNLLPVWLSGYTIGVAYIQRETRNEKSTCRSRYLVVIEETIVPKPRASPASIRMTSGRRRAYQVRCAVQLGSKKK